MKYTMRALFAMLLCLLVVLMALPAALAAEIDPDPDPATPDSETQPLPFFLMATGSDTHTVGSMTDLTFICTEIITSVSVDGASMANPGEYVLSPDGQTLSLTAAFLNSLTPGTHTVKVSTAAGNASADFTIKAAPTLTATGSDTHTVGSMTDLTFILTETITSVSVDGAPVANSGEYVLSPDGHTLSLTAAFLDSLTPGTHTVEVNTTAGNQASTTFTIKAAPTLTAAGSDPHIIGSGSGLVFTSSETIYSFDFDGTQLTDPTSYSLQGNTVILSPFFLNQLSPGKHSVGVYNAAGEYTSASFTIKAGPTLTATGNNTHTRYSMTDLSFTCSDTITTVIVDGEKLTANFSLSKDGTTVTLSAGFLDQLTPGEHTISVYVYNPMEIQTSTTFFIEPVMTLTATGSNIHEPGSMNDLSFVCDDVIADAYVGSQQLNSADCGISVDGKTITLYAALLNKLKPDNLYTLRVYNAAGDSADATFKIADCPRLVPGTPLAADSEETLYFTAPENGYYRFDYQNGNTSYRFQVLDRQTGTWQNSPSMLNKQYAMGESIYVRPIYDQAATGKLNVLVRKITPPAADSIEVGAAYNVTNSSMTLDFTLNVTENTADNGYAIGLLIGVLS